MQGHALTVAERAELFGLACDYATLLRERESAKAVVKDIKPVAWRCRQRNGMGHWRYIEYGTRRPDSYELRECEIENVYDQAALEDVAPMLASARVPEDTLRLDAIKENSWDLMCFEMPTGAGDADIGWRVMEHYRADPELREVSVEYSDDPRKAIDSAVLAAAPKPETEE